MRYGRIDTFPPSVYQPSDRLPHPIGPWNHNAQDHLREVSQPLPPSLLEPLISLS